MPNYSDDVRSFDHDSRSPFYDDGGRDQAIEDKTLEVRDTLLSVNHKFEKAFIIDSDGDKVELSDFIADMEISDVLFSEYLGGGDLLKDKLNAQLDVYCEKIATGLIDNMEQENENY